MPVNEERIRRIAERMKRVAAELEAELEEQKRRLADLEI